MKLSYPLILSLFFLSCRSPYESGSAVYRGECLKCHTMKGEGGGTKGPDLTDIFSKKDEAYIRKYTIDPRSIKPDSTMPPSKLSDRELELLMEYMKAQTHSPSK